MKLPKKRRLSWADITLTLLSLEVMAYFYFGIRMVILTVSCMLVSVVTDRIAIWFMKKRYVSDDLISLADGMAIALMMPATVDFKIPILSCIFSVFVGKNLFGGRRNIIFSPCAVGYLFALTSWGNEILMYPPPDSRTDNFSNSLSHSLSYLFNTTGKVNVSDFDILIGNFEGPMGTVSILLLIVIACVLIFRKAISTGAFIGLISGILFMSYVCPVNENRIESLKYVMSTNMFLFAAIYIISDKRVAPLKNYYSFFYGLFSALISYIILLTTAKENMIVTVSVIMTPMALILKEIQIKIESYISKERIFKNTSVSEETEKGQENE